MNRKNITRVLNKKMNDWVASIEDKEIQDVIKENAIITGGALVSLLNNEEVNDYDIYFRTHEACLKVAKYYAKYWNDTRTNKPFVEIRTNEGRVTAFIASKGVAMEDGENGIDDESEPFEEAELFVEEDQKDDRPRYRPRFFSTNAISLSDKIQLVIRFYGDVGEIHTNYDFVHCTCSYDYKTNQVDLPAEALEAIINKELQYTGSKYPLCSIIRSRKFIQRGWSINAGQYLKMCLQLNELNLKDLEVFKDQLAGVDSLYFNQAINIIQKKQENDFDFKVDNNYLFEVINRIF